MQHPRNDTETTPIEMESPRRPDTDPSGKYKLLEKIGEGGFGEVWVAEQNAPVKRRVAIKIIKLGMDTRQVVARFEAERQALALMDHPNIAKVFDGGVTELGRPFFVMELVKGVPITEYCETNKIGTQERLQLFILICRAIQHAHQKGIIHRDIKPSNILVTMQDGVAVPKVIDFGIAKATEGRLTDQTVYTQLHQFMGTPAYMSPEQAEMTGIDIDTRSDIYSLGVLLYELLTGTTPFDSKELLSAGLDEMRRIIREKDPPRPSTRLSQGPERDIKRVSPESSRRVLQRREIVAVLQGDLDWIVMKCLEKDRVRRYDTANGVAMDIERHLGNEAVIARPPSFRYTVHKFIRRNWLATAAGVTVAFALISGSGLATVGLIRARTQRNRAEESEQLARRAQVKEAELRQQAEAATRRARRALYAADMLLVERAMSEGDLGHMRRLLEKYLPAPGSSEDLRGWEWRHYWNETRSAELFTLSRRDFNLIALTFAGENSVAALHEDGLLLLYDLGSRRLLHSFQITNENNRLSPAEVRCDLSADGRFLIVTSGYQLLLLESGSLRLLQKRFFEEPVQAVRTEKEPASLLAKVGFSLQRFSLPELGLLHSNSIPPSAFSVFSGTGEFAYLLSASNNLPGFSFQIRDLVHDNPLASGHCSKYDWGRPAGTHFSPDAQWIVESAAHPGKMAVIREASSGQELAELTGFLGWVISAAWSPDSKFLALGSADRRICIYSTDSWQRVAVLKGHWNEVSVLTFSPDGSLLLSGDKDGEVKVWSAGRFPQPAGVSTVQLILSKDGRFAWQEKPEGFALYRLPDLHFMTNLSYRVWDVSSDGTAAATFERGRVLVRNLIDNSIRAESSHFGSTLQGMALSRKGDILGYVDSERLYFWHLGGREEPDSKPLFFPASSRRYSVILSPQADRAAVNSVNTVGLYSLRKGGFRHLLTGQRQMVTDMAFSPDGMLLATASFDASVNIWDSTTGTLLRTLRGQPFAFESVSFSYDGTRMAAGGVDGTIRIWETGEWQPVGLLHQQTAWVPYMAFGPSDSYLVAASRELFRIYEAGQD